MAKEQLGIVKKDQEESRLRAIRNDLIIRLHSDMLGYGKLTNREIANVLAPLTHMSVYRIAKYGKNTWHTKGS